MKLFVCGDFVPQNRVERLISLGDFSFFDEVREIAKENDYSIVNFESPVVNGDAKPIIKTGPNIKCDNNAMKAVNYAGFNCVTLANNHFYDYGDKGVEDTICACVENGIDYVGGGVNIDEAESILFKEINGKVLGIINVCEHEWSIASQHRGGSAPLNLIQNVRNIHKAKSEADFVLMIIHGGTEHYQLPSPRMKETYRFFIEEGADAVVNHHQHCFSGYEVFDNKPILYGLGNFCFDKDVQSDILWNAGYAVQLVFVENGVDFKLFPYVQCSETPNIHFIKEVSTFENEINELNKIIKDDNALRISFKQMAVSRKSFLEMFEPYKNKYMRILKEKGLLPSFVTSKQKNIIMELFRCEAHRDVMFELLSTESIINK